METMNVNYPGYIKPATEPVIVLPTCKGTMVIPVQQIIRIQSISNYSKIFLINGKTVVVAKVLRFFEEHPQLASFVRIHRTHLVNMNFIKTYRSAKTGMLFLNNGERIAVARRKKACIAGRLNHLHEFFEDERVNTSSFNTKKIIAA